jgi:hypothetical protein
VDALDAVYAVYAVEDDIYFFFFVSIYGYGAVDGNTPETALLQS